MKKIISVLALQTLSFICLSHEFWMQPIKFSYRKGEVAGINFMVGENFEGARWSLKRHRIVRLENHHSIGTEKIALDVDTLKQPILQLPLRIEGENLLVMQSNNAYLELEADKFNAYLKEDGLEDILKQREETNTTLSPSREHYQRNTKLLLSCGTGHNSMHSKKVGLPLEIIALNNPYSASVGDEVQFQLFFQNQAHRFSLVKVWHKHNGRTVLQNVYSDKDGIVTLRMTGQGAWMISSVKMVASTEPTVDWQSYWGSFVFGLN